MKSVYNFVVKPKGERYNNTKKLGGKELILNTEIFNHQYVNREAVVISTPLIGNTDIKPGDTVIVHHNVFRRWHNVKGIEKNSRSYFNESIMDLQKTFEEEYGTYDINIQDGTINHKDEQTDKKN